MSEPLEVTPEAAEALTEAGVEVEKTQQQLWAEQVRFFNRGTARLIRYLAGDELVAQSARVSTAGANSDQEVDVTLTAAKDAGLVRALLRERHGTPFEHCVFTFEIHASIMVAREAHRHRIASISEESGRYKVLAPAFYIPTADRPLVKVEGTKTMEYAIAAGEPGQIQGVNHYYRNVCVQAWIAYQDMLANGILPEVARGVLPLCVGTSWHLTLNARSLMNFLSLRVRKTEDEALFPSKPMLEINHIADDMEAAFAQVMPVTHAAFVGRKRVAP